MVISCGWRGMRDLERRGSDVEGVGKVSEGGIRSCEGWKGEVGVGTWC